MSPQQQHDENQRGTMTTQPQQRQLQNWGSSLFDDRLFDPFGSDFLSSRSFRSANVPTSISIDVVEAPEHYAIKAAIPGVQKEDVKVDIDSDRNGQHYLVIQAEKKHQVHKSDDNHRHVYSESSYGTVSRRIPLPEDVNLDRGVDAKMEHGELKLTVPRSAETKSRRKQITIQ